MAYIYKITNTENGKCYIGKTEFDPEKRFREHIQDSKKERNENRPLYRAFNKYGIDKFSFEILEETDSPEEREQILIKEFNSYGKTGYNATLGGDGKKYLDHDKIIEDYLILQNMILVAKNNNCHVDSVKKILTINNIEIISSSQIRKNNGNAVLMLNKKTEEILMEFSTQMDAARYLQEEKLSNTSNTSSLASKISLVCKGKRQTCSGFKWKYLT